LPKKVVINMEIEQRIRKFSEEHDTTLTTAEHIICGPNRVPRLSEPALKAESDLDQDDILDLNQEEPYALGRQNR
jgi:hypothetical protein